MAAMKKAVLRRKTGTELPKATPIPNATGKATMTKLPYTTRKTAAKNASKTFSPTTEARTSYAGGAVSGGLGRKVSRPLTSSKMRANPRPTNPKAVTQHMASKSKKYTY